MPERSSSQIFRISMRKLALGLSVAGLLVVYSVYPSNIRHHHPSPSTLLHVAESMNNLHGNTLSLDSGHSSGSSGKLFVNRLHPRHLSPATEAETIAARAYKEGEREICVRGPDSCGNADAGSDYDEKHRRRYPPKWSQHRGPPNKHSPSESKLAAEVIPMTLSLRHSQEEPSVKIVSAGSDLVHRAAARNKHSGFTQGTTIPRPSASTLQTAEPPNTDSNIVEQTADKPPRTSMNLGIHRPKPAANSHTPNEQKFEPRDSRHTRIAAQLKRNFGCLSEPELCYHYYFSYRNAFLGWPRWWQWHKSKRSNLNNDAHTLGDKKVLLAHSESTSNENFHTRRETLPVTWNKNQVEERHSELVPSRLICDCPTYMCTNYRKTCKRWRQVPDRKRSTFEAPAAPRAEADRHLGENELIPAPSIASGDAIVQNQRQDSTSVRSLSPGSGDKHYIPAYWRNNDYSDATPIPKAAIFPRAETISHQEQHIQKGRNGTYSKPVRVPKITIADIFAPKKCHDTNGIQRCEGVHQGSIIFYSLLGVLVISIFLLVLLRCYTCFKRRRNVAVAKHGRVKSYDKSVTSSHASLVGDSLSSKREQHVDNPDSSRHFMNLGGADNSWPRREHRRTWNVFSRNSRVPGRFSPIPQARAPRIPTLKLPKAVFATVRKVSNLGFEGMLVSYKKGFKGKATDVSRVKWTSTI